MRKRARGQATVEYIVIVGLVAILGITSVSAFSGKLKTAFASSTNAIDHHVTQKVGSVPSSSGSGGGGGGGGAGDSASGGDAPTKTERPKRPSS